MRRRGDGIGGVIVIHYFGRPDQLVRLPEHYELDVEATEELRSQRAGEATSGQPER